MSVLRIPGPPLSLGSHCWPSRSRSKHCSSRPSRSAWSLMRRCEPGPGSGAQGDGCSRWGWGRRPGSRRQRRGRRRRVRALHSPYGPDFPRYLMVPGSAPGGSSGALGSISRRSPTLRGSRGSTAPMSAPSRGAGSTSSDCRPGCFLWNGSLRVPTFVGFASGTLVAKSGSSDQEMPGDDSNYDDNDNKRSRGFSGPCLFFTSR